MVAKLTDVAELAGVSPTTVSRVINKKGYLSQKPDLAELFNEDPAS